MHVPIPAIAIEGNEQLALQMLKPDKKKGQREHIAAMSATICSTNFTTTAANREKCYTAEGIFWRTKPLVTPKHHRPDTASHKWDLVKLPLVFVNQEQGCFTIAQRNIAWHSSRIICGFNLPRRSTE